MSDRNDRQVDNESNDRSWGSDSGRNFRNADLWFQSVKGPHGLCGVDDELVGLDVTAEPTSVDHFAAYPSRLVEPFVKAGTSEKGCCPTCGTPWERKVEKRGGTIGKSWHDHSDDLGRGQRPDAPSLKRADYGNGEYSVQTLGWQPGCDCPAHEPIPCTVLDPFNGTGTTGAVALRHGRHYIGIELFEKHAETTRQRLERTLKPQTHRVDVDGDAPLFQEGDE